MQMEEEYLELMDIIYKYQEKLYKKQYKKN